MTLLKIAVQMGRHCLGMQKAISSTYLRFQKYFSHLSHASLYILLFMPMLGSVQCMYSTCHHKEYAVQTYPKRQTVSGPSQEPKVGGMEKASQIKAQIISSSLKVLCTKQARGFYPSHILTHLHTTVHASSGPTQAGSMKESAWRQYRPGKKWARTQETQ